MIKRAIVLTDTTENYENDTASFFQNLRNLGTLEVRARLRRNGWSVESLEFATIWQDMPNTKFFSIIDMIFKNADESILAISSAIIRNLPYSLEPTLKYVRECYPKTKIILGGIRAVKKHEEEFFSKYFDSIFIGRSMEMFEEYLQNNDMSKYCTIKNKPWYTNTSINYDIEKPLVCDLIDDTDFITEHDVLGIELGLGCKFNCSFCNYPLRNAKKVYLSSEDALAQAMQSAYDRYGVTNFYVADDTSNETDEKLNILVNAVDKLSFVPNLGGFARLDVLANRPHQLELFKKINFQSFVFGVETFNPEASKLIRKKHSSHSVEDVLTKIKKEIPHACVSISLIIGLEKDDPVELMNICKYLVDKKLVHMISAGPLDLKDESIFLVNEDSILSSMDNFPTKFGYTMDKDTIWKSSSMDFYKAKNFYENTFLPWLIENNLNQFLGFTFLNLRSSGLIGQFESAESVIDKLKNESLFKEYRLKINRLRSAYMKNKFKQIEKKYET